MFLSASVSVGQWPAGPQGREQSSPGFAGLAQESELARLPPGSPSLQARPAAAGLALLLQDLLIVLPLLVFEAQISKVGAELQFSLC